MKRKVPFLLVFGVYYVNKGNNSTFKLHVVQNRTIKKPVEATTTTTTTTQDVKTLSAETKNGRVRAPEKH